jgi:hypothetical protein
MVGFGGQKQASADFSVFYILRKRLYIPPVMDNCLPSARDPDNLVSAYLFNVKTFAMKKLLIIAAVISTLSAAATNTPEAVTDRVLKAFKETFREARDITWHNYPEYYQANFKQAEVQIRAQFSDDGTLLKTIRYYGEEQLLPNVVARLKKRYAGKEIYGVTETSSNDDVNFVINLRDDDHYYIVTSDVFGNLQQTDKFKRADK